LVEEEMGRKIHHSPHVEEQL